jgi:hypothetical protein
MMRALLLLALALLISPHPPPDFSATWARPGVAVLRWTQMAGVHLTCLSRETGGILEAGGWGLGTGGRKATQPASSPQSLASRTSPASRVLIRCWVDAPPGPIVVALGSVGPLDAAYRPAAHDVYVLEQDGARQRAPLRGVVWLAWAGR